MELNRKIFKIGIISIIIILVIILGFVFSIRLENPVFLKSLIENRIEDYEGNYQHPPLRIKYISNIDDNRQVSYIELIEKDDNTYILLGNGVYQKVEKHGIYNMNTLEIEIYIDNVPKKFDRLEFNRGNIVFNNGDRMEVDLGRIILYKRDRGKDYFQFEYGGGSSDGTSHSQDTVLEDISLIEVESPLFKEAQGLYGIEINGKDYREIKGMDFKEGDTLRVDSIFRTPESILDRYTQFELQPRLYFQDSKGDISYINILNIRHDPYIFDFQGIYKYLKARGEI